jgi:hypothetical protein
MLNSMPAKKSPLNAHQKSGATSSSSTSAVDTDINKIPREKNNSKDGKKPVKRKRTSNKTSKSQSISSKKGKTSSKGALQKGIILDVFDDVLIIFQKQKRRLHEVGFFLNRCVCNGKVSFFLIYRADGSICARLDCARLDSLGGYT